MTKNNNFKISIENNAFNHSINIAGSKSETNRLLLLKAIFPNINISNISNSDDSKVMKKSLDSFEDTLDIHHAGTAMRFLTAYFSTQENKTVTLTGSPRMKERPIKILVDALKQLDVKIDYLEKEGFPPIKIYGQKIIKNNITLESNVSSQYISALLLIASKLENGLTLNLKGVVTSKPYIQMTLFLLEQIGVETFFEGNKIFVRPSREKMEEFNLTVESDWSSASYFYSIIALAESGSKITLSTYRPESLQGDSSLKEIYLKMGVRTEFVNNKIILTKVNEFLPENLNLSLNDTPDIAQTIAVTCFGLGISCHLSGLHTLKIKETDRLEALKKELLKLGANIDVTDDSLTIKSGNKIKGNIKIATYNDHRMAMAFAPLAIKVPIIIENADVVSKSYPDFWKDLKNLGFEIVEGV
jgi:3-phosphoshikimate 1-carboxyvinyltransferase